MSTDRKKEADDSEDEAAEKTRRNSAPDAVKDPNEKTDGKPGVPPGADQGGDADPGGG